MSAPPRPPVHPSVAAVSSRELYLRLLTYVRPYRRIFILSMVTMAAAAATEPLFPALMQPLLDKGFATQNREDVWLLPLGIIAIFLVRGVLGFISSYALAWVSNRLIMDLRNAMFHRLVRLPTRFFDDQSSGILISRVAFDVNNVTSAATTVLTSLVKDSLTVVGLLGWLFWLNWRLTLVTLVTIPAIALIIRVFSKRLRSMSRASQFAMGDITHVLEESIGAHKVVKIYGGQDYEAARFQRANAELRGYNMRQTVAASATVPLTQLLAALALSIVIGLAINQSADNQTTVGGFVSFITAMLMLLTPLKHLADLNAPLQRGLAAAESVFSLLDEAAEADRGHIRLEAQGRPAGRVDVEGIRFRYPGADRDALKDFSLHIAPGQTVALVGASGSGKTTLANLLPRFYSVEAGEIRIDGHNVEDVALDSLRAQISLVSQDVVLFNDTIAANIAYGTMHGADEPAIIRAAEAAHAWEFIRQQPAGLNTMIGENGVKLSGGQRQRLAIARALLKDAPILILDEATSALDNESERAVQAALEVLMQHRTTLVIAHRLSTIERADRIVVLSQGQVVESGTHAELLAQDGHYARLYRLSQSEGRLQENTP